MCSLQCIYSDISQFPRGMHTSHSWDVMQFIFLLSLCKNNVSLGFVNPFMKTGDYRSLNHLDRYFYPSGAWTRIFLQNEIDTIVVDAMALWAVRLLAKNEQGIVFHWMLFQLLVSDQCREILEDAYTRLWFLRDIQHVSGEMADVQLANHLGQSFIC